ncbi:MAG: alanine racemase [Pseudomonadota bacterium]|nr:alanine racemase [Pseudomonadota bacterium]
MYGPFLEIDPKRVVVNYRRIRAHAGQAECSAVVKADSYGLGVEILAPLLSAEGCRTFFVTDTNEAATLRTVLPDPKTIIYALDGPCSDPATLMALNVIPVLNHPGQLESWRKLAAKTDKSLPAALHVDTGMNRLGFEMKDAEQILTATDGLAGITPRLIMSHLACADEPDHPMNAAQLARFAPIRSLLPDVPASLANSAGILLGGDYLHELVRPGAALYGINPLAKGPTPVIRTAKLLAPVLQLREVDRGWTVGYGASCSCLNKRRVATISIGYANGFLRSLSNRGHVHAHGVDLPVLGRVSMDLLTVDATDCPALAVGDAVEIIGDNRTVDQVAREAGTIGYEVLTSLGNGRLPRHYGQWK